MKLSKGQVIQFRFKLKAPVMFECSSIPRSYIAIAAKRLCFMLAWQIVTVIASADEASVRLEAPKDGVIRVASFNMALNRKKFGELSSDLEQGDKQAERLAKIVQLSNQTYCWLPKSTTTVADRLNSCWKSISPKTKANVL